MTPLPKTDVVIIGLGWTGAILAERLTAAGLNVVAIERGPWRDTASTFPPTYAPDELRYRSRHGLFLPPVRETVTFRHNAGETALPVRSWGSFMPSFGVGGGGVHWNAETWRFLPTDFRLKSHLTERYGKRFLPDDMTIQDWGITYEELEPYYDAFEYLCGTSGKAGNLKGAKQDGGNPFEGSRSRDYPTPPQMQPYGPTLFAKAAREMGYNPFPQPSGNLSHTYTNPLGVKIGQCSFCGFCEWFGCGNYSKASPQTTILPVLVRRPGFEARTECEVTRINLDSSRKRAVSVTYVDASKNEWEQPAEIVVLCAFQLFNVAMLLNSGIGTPYDPSTGEGVIGRNYSYQVTSSVQAFFDDKNFNPFVSSGAIGMCIDEFNGDNFDHRPHGFVGGGYMGAVQTNGRPIETTPTPTGTPRWGVAWKQAVAKNYLGAYQAVTHGSCYSYRDAYLDLDPTYTDKAIETPFGTVLSSNITPDPETGIGKWSDDAFVNAVQRGNSPNGRLYPAMPFVYYAHANRDDILAIRAYLKTVPPARNAVHENQLPFPFYVRPLMIAWDWMFYRGGPYRSTAGKSDDWNRGGYIVQTLGHCGACHTPKNFLGGDRAAKFAGATLQHWHADNLTGDPRTGLGSWDPGDVETFLKSGHNNRADAVGSMREVVMDSTSAFDDADLCAVAVYLKDMPPRPEASRPRNQQHPAARSSGEAIYRDNCEACHTGQGTGAPGLFTPLAGSASVQANDASNLIRVVLEGVRSASTDQAPTAAAMPSFSWRLSDAEIADVLTYIRTSWNNAAPEVSETDVAVLRKALRQTVKR